MSKWPRRSRDGFTLVEALVAGVILALSAGVLGVAVRGGMRSMTLAREYQTAAELMDRVLTKIDVVGAARMAEEGPLEGAFEPPNESFSWSAQIVPRQEGDLCEVTVKIVWESGLGTKRSVEAQTLLNDPVRIPEDRPAWDEL